MALLREEEESGAASLEEEAMAEAEGEEAEERMGSVDLEPVVLLGL